MITPGVQLVSNVKLKATCVLACYERVLLVIHNLAGILDRNQANKPSQHDDILLLCSSQAVLLSEVCTAIVQVLTDHTDEVWHVAFSHNGTMLASASKDMTAIIYHVQRQEQRIVKQWVLTGHTGSIGYLGWSPDDTMLATCGNDMILRLWSSSTGECLQEMSHHSKEVSSVAWLPDSESTRPCTRNHDSVA